MPQLISSISRFICFFLFLTSSLFASWQTELVEKIQQSHFPSWMLEQIHEDLEPFKIPVSRQDIQNTLEVAEKSFFLCNIQNNELSWECYSCNPNDFRIQMFTAAIAELCKIVHLPDVVFIVYPGEAFTYPNNEAPVFTWCKHQKWSKRSVFIPDYEALSGNDKILHDAQLGSRLFPWNAKIDKAIWRGGTTGGWGFDFMPRLKLTQLSREIPELLDAKFTGIFPGQDESVFSPFLGNFVSVLDSVRYKYQILIDGHVSAFSRAHWQLFSNSVIFKNSSPWYQWFYRELRPYVHYIPYEADASDLEEKIRWAMNNDDIAFAISQNANMFANENLKHSDIMLYTYILLNEYAKILDSTCTIQK